MIPNRMVEQGNWLFRWRSYLPIAMLLPIGIGVSHFRYWTNSPGLDYLWTLGCLGVSILGLLVRAVTVGRIPRSTSGGNTRQQKAEKLNTTGMYSLTRNPLYLGNFLIWLGIVLVLHDLLLISVFCLAFWLYYERIIAAEEAFLSERFGGEYAAWAARTPAFFPSLAGWRKPELSFSIKHVLRRDYHAILGIASAYLLLNLAEHLAVEGEPYADPLWWVLFATGVVVFAVLRLLKKHTSMLAVVDR